MAMFQFTSLTPQSSNRLSQPNMVLPVVSLIGIREIVKNFTFLSCILFDCLGFTFICYLFDEISSQDVDSIIYLMKLYCEM